MHPNFYHWHSRVDLKPDTAILSARWKAAEQFVSELDAARISSLLCLALFNDQDPVFAKVYAAALTKNEPTFPEENNALLLKVMATASLYSLLDESSAAADMVALGLQAANFVPDRTTPICRELSERSAEYRAKEADSVRPTPETGENFEKLKAAISESNEVSTAVVAEAVAEIGYSLNRVAEENQFLWWLLGKRSSLLNSRRADVSIEHYALAAALEASKRVVVMPPPDSIDFLIGEVLSQCSNSAETSIPIIKFIESANLDLIAAGQISAERRLTPVSALLELRRTFGKLDGDSLAKVHLPSKFKISGTAIAQQYFRELLYLRAAETV